MRHRAREEGNHCDDRPASRGDAREHREDFVGRLIEDGDLTVGPSDPDFARSGGAIAGESADGSYGGARSGRRRGC